MVRINRVHGFTERINQLHRNSTLENSHAANDDCLMRGGSCECVFIEQCKFIKKDLGEDNG